MTLAPLNISALALAIVSTLFSPQNAQVGFHVHICSIKLNDKQGNVYFTERDINFSPILHLYLATSYFSLLRFSRDTPVEISKIKKKERKKFYYMNNNKKKPLLKRRFSVLFTFSSALH